MKQKFLEIYGENIPNPSIKVEASISPYDVNLNFLQKIDAFRPFGLGNPKPLWLFENVQITEVQFLGTEQKHIKIFTKENPLLPIILWHGKEKIQYFQIGNKVSLLVDFDKNIWKEKITIQGFIKHIIKSPN